MNLPTIYAHWTDDAPTAVVHEACRLLDLGLPALVFTPPERAAETLELFFHCAESTLIESRSAPGDAAILGEYRRGERPVLVIEALPRGTRTLGEPRHVLLPWLARDWPAHAAFLQTLAGLESAVRLHLFVDPEADHDPHVRALLRTSTEIVDPISEDIQFTGETVVCPPDPDARLAVSTRRFFEHHPSIVSPAQRDPGETMLTPADLTAAVHALSLPAPTALDIATRRMRNSSPGKKPQ